MRLPQVDRYLPRYYPYGTASSLQRHLRCPGPLFYQPGPYESSDAAERGQALHRYIELYATLGREKALADVPDKYREYAEQMEPADLPQGALMEVAMAYNVHDRTARVLGQGIGRNYGTDRSEIPGTADAVIVGDDAITVIDWKFGNPDYVPEPFENAQLHFLGLCAAWIWQKPKVHLELYFFPPDDPRSPHRKFYTASRARLAAFQDRLGAWVSYIDDCRDDEKSPELSPSARNCRFCRSKWSCPVMDMRLGNANKPDYVLPQEFAQAYEVVRQTKLAADELDKRFKFAVKNTKDREIGLDGGRAYGVKMQSRSSIDQAKAKKYLEMVEGDEFMSASADSTITKKSLKRACEKIHGPGTRYEELLAELENFGAIKTTQIERISEYGKKASPNDQGSAKSPNAQ